ncbi:hypothetical protein AND4_09627 [Vibrio sp. AND4]|nr:hypothetical protein AND4_09627 [Vibrio sp. AND4]
MIRCEVGIAHSHADIGVTENIPQYQNVAAIHHKVARKRVA